MSSKLGDITIATSTFDTIYGYSMYDAARQQTLSVLLICNRERLFIRITKEFVSNNIRIRLKSQSESEKGLPATRPVLPALFDQQ